MPSVSDVLDLLGLLLLAAGLGYVTHGLLGLAVTSATIPIGVGLVVAAVVVLAGSWLSDRKHREDR